MAIEFEHLRTSGANPFVRVRRGTPWPMRMAVLTGVLVAVLPLIVIVLAAVLAASVVYFVCAVLARIGKLFNGGNDITVDAGSPAEPERENVRVVGGV